VANSHGGINNGREATIYSSVATEPPLFINKYFAISEEHTRSLSELQIRVDISMRKWGSSTFVRF